MRGPFFGYVIYNKKRESVVLDTDTTAFVWDDQAIAEDHMREGEDDEVIYVRIERAEQGG
jgi:hypothetical protein